MAFTFIMIFIGYQLKHQKLFNEKKFEGSYGYTIALSGNDSRYIRMCEYSGPSLIQIACH